MRDIREEIIVRLAALAPTVPLIRDVLRQVNSIDDEASLLPLAIILDGDEMAIDDEPSRRSHLVPRRVEMTPLIQIVTAAKAEEIGPDLNTLRRSFIKAVLNDADLQALVDRHGIRYDGMETPRTETGRMMLGQKILRFTFTYLLDPDDL